MTEFDPNRAAVEEWIEATDGFDRVEAVVSQTREPATAASIAGEAHVSESTARKHLRRLVDLGVAVATEDAQRTRYARAEDHHLMARVRELQRTQTREELLAAVEEFKSEVEAYREEYGVDSPEELALQVETPDGPADPWGDLTEWQTTRQHLAVARAALAYKRAHDLAEA